ncbi:hypothetical protein CHS0354_036776 [Potamilus streckersoni]|uniref:Ring finger protein 213 n=1 Tax=Potamilus streckersoni TaxID=2493646 RepID=A0AAE0S5B2_9BIVA|nr:hypothetical protein CHS0354_036776 [Potamilus streckersoni]
MIRCIVELQTYLEHFEKPEKWSELLLRQHAHLTYKIAGLMISATLREIKSLRILNDLIAAVVQVFLQSIALYDSIEETRETSKSSAHLEMLMQKNRNLRSDWLRVEFYLALHLNLKETISAWNSFLSPDNLKSPKVASMWNDEMVQNFKNQMELEISSYPWNTGNLIQFYCTEVNILHQRLQTCLSDLAFKAVDSGYKVVYIDFNPEQLKRFGYLLSLLFEDHWKKSVADASGNEVQRMLTFMLTWPPFSHFMALTSGDKKILGFLSGDCVIHLKQCTTYLSSLMSSCQDGTITLDNLELFLSTGGKFLELTESLQNVEKESHLKMDVPKAIAVRQKEVDCYKCQREKIKILLNLCQYVPSVDISSVQRRLEQLSATRMLRIVDICEPVNMDSLKDLQVYKPQIKAFLLPASLHVILDDLESRYKSRVFLKFWEETGKKNQVNSLEELFSQVWQSVNQEWLLICHEIVSGQICFQKFEDNLGKLSVNDDYGPIDEEMKSLNVGKEKRKTRIVQLKQYRQLRKCIHGARIILKFASALELMGDFSVIEEIASKKKGGETKMKDFDDSLIQTCELLKDLTTPRSNCLEAVITSKNLLKWLRESMKGGVRELKVFVDLASISAGEGDMEIDKVNCLHAAITGYAPLIFDLKKNSDYRILLEKCRMVWDALEADPNLPQKLESISHQLDWLQSVKQAHGSVEVTSLEQASAINAGGIYFVGKMKGIKENEVCQDLHKVVLLTVSGDGKKREYTFEQLQDLQSRLMLVAGKAEQGNNNVDRFTMVFDSVTRLASVYIKLISAGCILYKNWQARFFCRSNPVQPVCAFIHFGEGAVPLKGRISDMEDITSIIPKIARFMERCLEKWLGYINEKRNKYFELNFFTTDQLVFLQQELVKIGTVHGPDIRIYPLLSAVKENCTCEDLVNAMQRASKDVEEVQMEMAEDKECKIEKVEKMEEDDEEKIVNSRQLFIKEMINGGYSEIVAKEALKHLQPDQIAEGLVWCFDNEESVTEESIEEVDMVSQDETMDDEIKMSTYGGWTRSDTSVTAVTASIINKLEVAGRNVNVEPLIKDLKHLWKEFLSSVSSSVKDYLSVEHLGLILKRLSETDALKILRPFPPGLVKGSPNLIVCSKADILRTLLSVYMVDSTQPLPQADEVLMCDSHTTLDQLDVFWRRSLGDRSSRIHCLVNADLLNFEVSDRGERCLENYMQQGQNEGYCLIVICCSENEYRSRMVTALDKYRRRLLPLPNKKIASYIQEKLQVDIPVGKAKFKPAAVVDPDRSCVRIVKSSRAGMGKSLYVKRRVEDLSSQNPNRGKQSHVTVPLQDRDINISMVTQILLRYMQSPRDSSPRIFHLDISHEVQEGVDCFLFSLLILGCLTDSFGHVWRRSSRDLYLVETMPIMERNFVLGGRSFKHVHKVFDFLPYVICRSPMETLSILTNRPGSQDFRPTDQLFDKKEFKSPAFQRPYHYLSHLDKRLQRTINNPSEPKGTQTECLLVLLRHCGVPDPSWSELHHFVWFFDTQLRDFEKSIFCGVAVAEDLPGFPDFVLKFLIQMSRDFSTRSLFMSEESPTNIAASLEDEDEERAPVDEDLTPFQMRRKWESSPHPYLFFNPDGQTLTFVGFNIEQRTGNLVDLQTGNVLETAIMDRNLYKGLVRNHAPIQENFDFLSRGDKITRLCKVMGNEFPYDPDDTYELTTDNVKKILAIYMRFRCDIPVIIMGETGCGKTRLVKFLCELQTPPGTDVKNMVLMKVHGGITNADIIKKVQEAEKLAQENTKNYGSHMYTVLFFDEANTTESIGLIKEILCDKSMEGRPLKNCPNLKMVAACNPYRKHSEELIRRLEKAGLGYHVDADKTADRLGRVPMRRLVYRVQPLPQSLLPLVWDFGQLNTQIEDLYIRQMVIRYISQGRLPDIPGSVPVISRILTASQDFMRKQKDECSFVSLRDVDRVLNVMSWFYAQSQGERTLFDMLDEFPEQDSSDTENEEGEEDESFLQAAPQVYQNQFLDDITRSLVLAIGVCYHACLKKREEYREHIWQYFRPPLKVPDGPAQIEAEIIRCQDVFLDNVHLEKNIARNTALKENVFMMVICTELRIPLFLVGKPGSSKSLAKTIVADAMQGNAAHEDLFREFKQVQMVSFQCSPLSTPDGIMGTFRQCAQFQKDKDLDKFVSVVVLDEVGLAEDSPRMPLKTLHPLLEDGCQGDEEPEPYKKVAFIGISNWALDPAKMNRGILVQREVPDLQELENSAEGICSSDATTLNLMKPLIKPLAESYLQLFTQASKDLREFYGLRDFYSLIKMIYSFCEKSRKVPTWHQLLHAIKRNFGGLNTVNPVETFTKRLSTLVNKDSKPQASDPDCSPTGLIHACLFDVNKSQCDSRYLLLLTENYGALTILQQQILNIQDAIIIFGSSFPSDQEYTQVCRNINRIKVCMETGKTVVLLNLENLYESLYDALNQYYVYFGGDRYVDLGLGTHRVKCRVHKHFRLIVVAEKDVVYQKFPIPLINRLEKHFLTVNTMLTQEQGDLAKWLEKWADTFSTDTTSSQLSVKHGRGRRQRSSGEVFIGYHADTYSAIILFVWEDLHKNETQPSRNKILEESKKLLLWSATPEAVVRLEKCHLPRQEVEALRWIYWEEQTHNNLAEYLQQKVYLARMKKRDCFAQVTTHSKLLSPSDKEDISIATEISVSRLSLEALQSFDTEQQFSRKIRSFLESDLEEELLLVVQCDSGDTNANLVACARYCILDEHQQMKDRRTAPCHVIFIIQLPRIAGGCFSGFQCGLWHSVHIDDLRAQSSDMPTIQGMMGVSIATLMERAISNPASGNFAMETDRMSHHDVPKELQKEDISWKREKRNLQHMLDRDHDHQLYSKPSSDLGFSQGHQLCDVGLCPDALRRQSSSQSVANFRLNAHGLIMSCVMPALAMVKDREEATERSTKRITLVLKLLNETSTEVVPNFFKGVSSHLVTLLKEKEDRSGHNPSNWLSNEAAKPENITKAGTFRRACIQYLESRISPILAGIIAHIDTNQNLDILTGHISQGDWVAQLWMHIFKTLAAIQLKYSDFQSPAMQQELSEVIVKTTGCEGHTFQAELPFSWLIFEQIDAICRTAHENMMQEDRNTLNLERIVKVFKETPLGRVLYDFQGPVSSIVQLYTMDFINMTIKVQTDAEREIVHRVILESAKPALAQNPTCVLTGLVSIHDVYQHIAQHLTYFHSINQVWPECSETLKKFQEDNPDHQLVNEALDVQGLSLLLDQLNSQDAKSFSKTEGQAIWMKKVLCYRPVVEQCLTFYSSDPKLIYSRAVMRIRQIWTRTMVMKLFIEHVGSMDRGEDHFSVKNCMLLWQMSEKIVDLRLVESFEEVEKFLKICNRAAISAFYKEQPICPVCEVLIEGSPVTLPCRDVICNQCFHDNKALEIYKCPKCQKNIPADFVPDKTAEKSQEVKKFKDYQSRCNSFFMNIVSQLCFADNMAPSDEVVEMLLGYVTMTTKPGKNKAATMKLTKELTIFNECVDPNPVFRSFLLQLLLKTSKERIYINLEKYLTQAQGVMESRGGQQDEYFKQLCHLVVQCLEDQFHREATSTDEVEFARHQLKEARQLIQQDQLNMKLFGIAMTRFGLSVTAKYVHRALVSKETRLTSSIRALCDSAVAVCQEPCQWPKTFFIKHLCRSYGIDSYLAICPKREVSFLRGLCMEDSSKAEVNEVSDRYIVCGPDYVRIRDAVTKVAHGENIEKLDEAVKKSTVFDKGSEILVCLALHREITLASLHDHDGKKFSQKAIESLQNYCTNAEHLKNKEIIQALIQNTYGKQVAFLRVIPGLDLQQQGVLCLLVHCDLVLRNLHGERTLMQPLIRMATQPETLTDPYLPTMPQEDVADIKAALLAARGRPNMDDNPAIYRCPNGHPYMIGNCGRPAQEATCKECGAQIGGLNHALLPGNAPDNQQDMTETGHILGAASRRAQGAVPEREMSPAYCAVVRLMLHLSMMLGANHNPEAICQLIKPKITENMVIQFLMEHTQRDLNDLHRALGRSSDDVFVMLHCILNQVMQECNEKEKFGEEICGLRTKNARLEWERIFSGRLLAPVLQNLDTVLQEMNGNLARDKRLGSDPLLGLVFEINTPQETVSLKMLQEDPSMWSYRTRITIDHLRHEFDVQMSAAKKNQNQYKILHLFLREEHHLRALRFIPSIIKLHRILFQKFQWRLGRAEASSITVESVIREDRESELEALIQDYANAWELVRNSLSMTMQVLQEYCSKGIDRTTPISQLLPTSSGAGLCTWSLMRFLLKKQNDFLEEYCRVQKNSTENLPKVKLRDLTPAHLISYHPEQDILPMVLANCNYSFEVGKGTTIDYNFANLERQIIDRFLFGKSLIDIEIEEMVYRADYTNAATFRKLEEKIPQVPLSSGAKHKISEEFHSLPDLCQALDNLDIAISFLKSIGGNPESDLDKFMVETLKMEQSLHNTSAKLYCQYRHVKSLWLLLSLEKTKILAKHKEVIFDGIPEDLHQPLTSDLEKALKEYLQHLPLKCFVPLLELMFECIVLVISVPQNPDDEDFVDAKEKKFGDYLQVLLYDIEMDVPLQLENFPQEVLSKYCVSTWELAYRTLQHKERSGYRY